MKYYTILFIILLSSCSITSNKNNKNSYQNIIISKIYTGQYLRAIEYFEKNGRFSSMPKDVTMFVFFPMICESYARTLNLEKYEYCTSEMNNLLKTTFSASEINEWKNSLSLRYYYGKSLNYFLLGEYKKSLQYSNIGVNNNINTVNNRSFNFSGRNALVKLHEIYALSAININKKYLVKKSIYSLENMVIPNLKKNNRYNYSHPSEAERHLSLAKIYFKLKKYDKSIYHLTHENILDHSKTVKELYMRVGVPEKNIHGNDFSLISFTGISPFPIKYLLAKSYLEIGQYSYAETLFNEVNRTDNMSNYIDIYPFLLNNMAKIAIIKENKERAIFLLKKSIDFIETKRSSLRREGEKISFTGNKQDVYFNLVSLLVSSNRVEEAFEYAERAKSRALIDMLASRKFIKSKKTPDSLSIIKSKDKKINLKIYTSNSSMRSFSRWLTPVVKQYKETVSRSGSDYLSLMTVDTDKLINLQNTMSSDETFIEYYGNNNHYFIFVFDKKSIQAVTIKPNKLSDKIRRFRHSIMLKRSANTLAIGSTLYNDLLKPIKSMIRTKKITIIPHNALHYLPFSALSSQGKYVMTNYDIRILPSASIISILERRKKYRNNRLLVMANPKTPLSKIPNSALEGNNILKTDSNAKLLMGLEATETYLKQKGYQYSRLHFATHAYFDNKQPFNSAIYLSADSKNDGKLTVEELYNLKLNADLVVLSACETSLGSVESGNDIVGINRGFFYAGANAIISSLWSINDKATSDYMKIYYNTLNHLDKRSALRETILKIKDKYKEPYYWAAFSFSGI